MKFKGTIKDVQHGDMRIGLPKKAQQIRVSRDLIRRLDHRITPYFQFNLHRITKNIAAVESEVRPDRLFYAVKCNSLPRVLHTVYATGCGFEINNKAEWMHLDRQGLSHAPMINSSPITSAGDIRFLYAKGVRTFCFDSRAQVDNLAVNAPGASAYVRLYHGNTGSRFKLNRLGVDLESALDLIGYAGTRGLKPLGVTFHVGSQCKTPESFRQAIKVAARVFDVFPSLKVLNLGGGFPVAYGQPVPVLSSLGGVIRESLERYFTRRPEVWAEPGRFIVGDAAFTCASVIQVREAAPVSRAVIDMSVFSGFMEILEISDGFHYAVTGDSGRSGDFVRYDIGGPTCAGTDRICADVLLPRLAVNYAKPHLSSRLYFANTGAYTLDYIARHQQAGFNGARIPNIYYAGEGEYHEMAV
ncbi:MAG TPA: hypothetical protein DHV36_01320 [Desulfobacteraceae bacterium]|nr:hypothetical protein [Desulfobacteraceae bacterium]|tara:strand:- start:8 stop:1249 length:1242 start_codon:yes stop_codon:yes gene_type:complete